MEFLRWSWRGASKGTRIHFVPDHLFRPALWQRHGRSWTAIYDWAHNKGEHRKYTRPVSSLKHSRSLQKMFKIAPFRLRMSIKGIDVFPWFQARWENGRLMVVPIVHGMANHRVGTGILVIKSVHATAPKCHRKVVTLQDSTILFLLVQDNCPKNSYSICNVST